MDTYTTARVAAMIGIHPNTVRLYEAWGLIPKPERLANGYRVFTDYHVAVLRLARTAFQIEMLQNGLRRRMVEMVKTAASGDISTAILQTAAYRQQVRQEKQNAREAVRLVQEQLAGRTAAPVKLKRRETAAALHLTVDTLRNWEMNGLLTVKRAENGYRIYTEEDIQRLKIIRSLRCANYSLEAIRRMLSALSRHPDVPLETVLNTPRETDDVVTACDRLILSLEEAERNAESMLEQLHTIQSRFL